MSCPIPIKIDEALSRKIAFIGNLAACCIVAAHTWVSPEDGSVAWWVNRLCFNGGLIQMAVPLFFGLSGFLLAGKMSASSWYGRLILSKIATLIVPYCSFVLLWWIFVDLISRGALLAGMNLGAIHPIPFTIGNLIDMFGLNVNQTPGLSVLWFVRNLFLLFLVSPVFGFLRRRTCGGVGLAVLLAVYFAWEWSDGELRASGMFLSRTFSLRGLFYFCGGIYLRFHGAYILAVLSGCRSVRLLFVLAPAVLVGSVIYRSLEPFAVFVCIASCLLAIEGIDIRWFVDRTLSFPLYCLHPFILLILNGVLYVVVGREYVEKSFAIALVRWALTIAISFVVTKLLHRYAPRVASLLFGGR